MRQCGYTWRKRGVWHRCRAESSFRRIGLSSGVPWRCDKHAAQDVERMHVQIEFADPSPLVPASRLYRKATKLDKLFTSP